ncbi:MAG: hypothetical protein ACLGI7_16655, partial [Gammaproteobacteria bacterium]
YSALPILLLAAPFTLLAPYVADHTAALIVSIVAFVTVYLGLYYRLRSTATTAVRELPAGMPK